MWTTVMFETLGLASECPVIFFSFFPLLLNERRECWSLSSSAGLHVRERWTYFALCLWDLGINLFLVVEVVRNLLHEDTSLEVKHLFSGNATGREPSSSQPPWKYVDQRGQSYLRSSSFLEGFQPKSDGHLGIRTGSSQLNWGECWRVISVAVPTWGRLRTSLKL